MPSAFHQQPIKGALITHDHRRSSLFTAAFLPAERMLAGALRAGTRGGRQQMMEAGLEYAGMVASFRDAVKLSAQAFKLGDAILDPSNTTYELRNAISSAVNTPAIVTPLAGFFASNADPC